MPPKKNIPSVQQTAIGDGNVQIAGDNNTVNQTIIQKFFNIFKSDAESADQRNRRIMLGHVENFWVKGILEKSLHGAALLDLGIKEEPDALNYPWAIKREANKETLPAGTSMLEIFQEIGLGRSLLILGAPGSGKTTMLLELTRQLIERARADVTESIPVVFNLSSWTEKLSLADWLARELNVIYTIPKKTAPTWVKENKMLLLLDGLDEVRQESRDKCVDAINQFRKENGLTSMAVCSRIQDYAELKSQLSFDGAIEIQPLNSKQVNEYFQRFGEGLKGIKQILDKDTVLREMAETPLFLSIMTLAYRDTQSQDILVSDNLDIQRKQLFDTYIERMLERRERTREVKFKKQDILNWLSWLAKGMIENNSVPYLFENMQPNWLSHENQLKRYRRICGQDFGLIFGLLFALRILSSAKLGEERVNAFVIGWFFWLGIRLLVGVLFEPNSELRFTLTSEFPQINFWSVDEIVMVDALSYTWENARKNLGQWVLFSGFIFIVFWLTSSMMIGYDGVRIGLRNGLVPGLTLGILVLAGRLFIGGVSIQQANKTTYPGQRLIFTRNNFLLIFVFTSLIFGLMSGLSNGPFIGLVNGLLFGAIGGFFFGGSSIIQHYILRLYLVRYNLLPWKQVFFLNHCADLIFLRRVGGGYTFVHRLVMEHFAEMNFSGLPEDAYQDGVIDKVIDFVKSANLKK